MIRHWTGTVFLVLGLLSTFTWISVRAHPTPPETVPRSVFEALCDKFHDVEGYDEEVETIVLPETRPIFQTFLLRVIHGAGELTPEEAEADDSRDAKLRANFEPSAIHLPEAAGRCRWNIWPKGKELSYGKHELILELSNPVRDPHADPSEAQLGVFARHSLGGGQAAGWYWIALEPDNGDWRVSKVYDLPIDDG